LAHLQVVFSLQDRTLIRFPKCLEIEKQWRLQCQTFSLSITEKLPLKVQTFKVVKNKAVYQGDILKT